MKSKSGIFARFIAIGICTIALLFFESLNAQTAQEEIHLLENTVQLTGNDESMNHFVLDLQVLPGFYEKALLLEYIFADSKLLVDQTDITGASLNLSSDISNNPSDMIPVIKSYIAKAFEEGRKLSPQMKEEISQKYNKYR